MSVAAVMMVRDEADIIGFTLDHLLDEVDHVYVSDNGSVDGTRDVLALYGPDDVTVLDDPEVGYWQSRKTTELAMRALADGHGWVIPCDADEWWYATDGRTVRDFIAGLAPDVMLIRAALYNHIPTAEDNTGDPNPFTRIGWRKREHGALPKVACRLRPDLVIEAGNHGAQMSGPALASGGLVVRHFSWRSPQQYVRKVRNGEQAYRATTLSREIGAHWRMWENHDDQALVDHFNHWFFSRAPRADDTLIFDPAPNFSRPSR